MTDFYLIPEDPDKAYIRESLYLPKSKVRMSMVESALTFYYNDGKRAELYKEQEHHVIVPRNFVPLSRLQTICPIVDLRPTKYKNITFKSSIKLRTDLQVESAKAIRGTSGILVIPCGEGKTVVAMNEIAARKVPTLIIVNTEQLISQWCDQKDGLQKFLNMNPKDIGLIQGKHFDWEHPIVLATIQTLANRRDTVQEKIRRYFGLIIWDEVDEMATPVYSLTSDIFYGERMGLTATPSRRDGNDQIFKYHIGPILLQNETFRQKPKVYFHMNMTICPPETYINFYSDRINFGKLYTMLSKEKARNDLIKKVIKEQLSAGRKILVLGERKEQLIQFHEEFKDSGLCIHEVSVADRWEMLARCKVIFAIRKLSKRALNQIDLDTLITIFPMTDPGGLRQACGRILRECSTKQTPEVHIIEDVNIPDMEHMCDKMRKVFTEWGFDFTVKGGK